MTIEAIRMDYARSVAETAKLRSKALREAFATVPREAFLGPGPWSIMNWQSGSAIPSYTPTPNADLEHLYRDVLVAIDPSRQLNNGQPSFLAFCLDSLDIKTGECVVHIGCGVGYYTAIIADVVGPTGRVLGVEIDPLLAVRARENLAYLRQVDVVHTDGASLGLTKADAIFVNAGVTDIKRSWLDSLAAKGRMLVPITTQLATAQDVDIGLGKLLKVIRDPTGFSAEFISSVGIFHCVGARDPINAETLKESFARGATERVRSLRIDEHDANGTCWFHTNTMCLSTLGPGRIEGKKS